MGARDEWQPLAGVGRAVDGPRDVVRAGAVGLKRDRRVGWVDARRHAVAITVPRRHDAKHEGRVGGHVLHAAFRISRAGIAYVPEEREVFSNLTVDENLAMGLQPPREGAPIWTVEQMFGYFPVLRKRRNTRGGNLSGGEQQMLTICRSLLGNPRVILIDEPTEGLAPLLVAAVADVIREIHARGVAVLLVEQKLTIALKVASRLCVMGHGRIVFEGTPANLTPDSPVIKEWLAV